MPSNDPPIVEAMKTVADLWATPDMVYADGGTIAATPFQANAQPLLDGDCMMHRQASFFASFFPEGTEYGTGDGQVSTFYFPSASADTHPVKVGGTIPAAFRDAPEVWAVIQYFGSPDYADAADRPASWLEAWGCPGSSRPTSTPTRACTRDLEQQSSRSCAPDAPAASTPPTDADQGRPGHVLVPVDVVGEQRRG